ncbi:unnamed protein product [Lupinus luteus]|uniref:Uncharacterized protein n=1 Tax=Lupinus luteus TaxID=3873 RepID=A0AAV1XZK9_LUPLU
MWDFDYTVNSMETKQEIENKNNNGIGGSTNLYMKVMSDEQLEQLRQQISVYATICDQLVQMHNSITSQQDLVGLRLGSLYCDPMMGCSGHKISARQRWTPTPLQLQLLERIFDEGNGTPTKQKIKDITNELGQHGPISETNVYNWFQNRRARSKRKQLAPTSNNNNSAEPEAETEVESPKEKKTRPESFQLQPYDYDNSSPHSLYIHSPDIGFEQLMNKIEKTNEDRKRNIEPNLAGKSNPPPNLAGKSNPPSNLTNILESFIISLPSSTNQIPNHLVDFVILFLRSHNAMDQFDAFFRRADLDGDGRISGAEAVSFFQGSNLPKHVLAQIWMHADNAKTGFLGRNEFYNALRLVTVAQSKRDLTPDIVKAALYGPAAAKIPPPQINLAAIPPLQGNRPGTAPAPVSQMGLSNAPMQSQIFPYRGQQGLSGPVPNPQYFPSQQSTGMRPPQQSMPTPQPMPTSSAPRPQQTFANPGFSSDWYSGRPGMVATRPGMVATRPGGIAPSSPLSTSTALSPVSPMSQSTTVNTKALAVSGNVLSPNSALGNDFFSAASSRPTKEPAGQNFSFSVGPPSSAIVPVSSVARPKQNPLDSLQSSFSMQTVNSQFQQTQPATNRSNTSQQISPPASSPHASSGIAVGLGNTNSDNSQLSWPKMKPTDVQKYTKVFIEVDTDKDGRITGEQARSLFLSWRLPIDVLKKVWDLSDQDNDSMLSLKEFCFALYLMERYREGRPLPQSLPNNVLFDETLLSMIGHPKPTYGNAALGVGPGFQSQQGMPGARPVAPAAGLRPPVQGISPPAPGTMQPNQQKSGAPVLEDSFLNPTDNGDKDILNSNSQEAATAGKKVKETENVILDSREKIVFYRDKMQELVLYKSRCDNRLNEITERASADKREAETLGKKYEEKYKQVAEIASKLTVEEAKFRDIQERKSELQQAIVKMVQGGSADGILQVRAERIQSDLDGLFNALAERCKKHGIDVKSITMVQLPAGWQPGIAEDAALWDEDWDKFEDEGFANDLTFDMKNASSKPKPAIIHGDQSFPDDYSVGSPVNANGKHENSTNGDYTFEDESSYAHSEDELGRSPRDSPAGKTAVESPQGFSNAHFKESIEADAETNRSFDESTWGAFDNNDDVDSVWGFNPTKDSDLDHQRDFFTSGDDFGINPIRTGSTHTDGTFQTKSPFTFDDSVPATPASKFGNSPRYSEAGDFFDMSSRFDSFSMHESGYSPKAEPRFTRFDSISSSKDFGYNPASLSRFDSISSSKDFGYNPGTFSRFDSISSSKDLGFGREAGHARFDSISSTKDFGREAGHTRFDSISSTKDFGHSDAFSFDDTDPFGSSAPFKVSSESHSPKKNSDGWSAF